MAIPTQLCGQAPAALPQLYVLELFPHSIHNQQDIIKENYVN